MYSSYVQIPKTSTEDLLKTERNDISNSQINIPQAQGFQTHREPQNEQSENVIDIQETTEDM